MLIKTLNRSLINSCDHFKVLSPSTKLLAPKITFIFKIAKLNKYKKKFNITIKKLCANGFKIKIGRIIGKIIVLSLKIPLKKKVTNKFKDQKKN